MQTTFSTTLTCGACLQKVAPWLDGEPSIKSWDSDLQDPRKLVRVDLTSQGDPNRIIELIRQAGFDATVIQRDQSITSADVTSASPTFRISAYKPLFLVLIYVVGASILMEMAHEQWQWARVMQNFMGFFFLGFAFFKLLDIPKFADAFATYDIVAARSRTYAISYPWIEVTLGFLFVTGTWVWTANLVTAIIMSIGLIGVISAVQKKQAIQCACLGTAFNLPMSVVTIIENTVMIVMAIAMLAM